MCWECSVGIPLKEAKSGMVFAGVIPILFSAYRTLAKWFLPEKARPSQDGHLTLDQFKAWFFSPQNDPALFLPRFTETAV